MIKKVTLEDLDQLTSLFDQYVVFYKKPSNLVKHKAFLHDRIKNNEATIYIAYDENDTTKAIGFVLNYITFSSLALNKIIILNDLFVDTSIRKKGTGEKLILRTVELAKELGTNLIRLRTAKNNIVAQGLYIKMGFVREDFLCSYDLTIK